MIVVYNLSEGSASVKKVLNEGEAVFTGKGFLSNASGDGGRSHYCS
jgi:predicted nucleic acid-binding Zn ribbon protein